MFPNVFATMNAAGKLFLRTASVLILTSLYLTGCASSPFPQELRDKARLQPTFSQLKENADNHKGAAVILGGTVIKTTNAKDYTEVEVLQKPLDISDRPEDMDVSEGRFLIHCKDFLDPEIFKQGREISVAGDIDGQEARPLGEITYSYPVISCRKLKLWYERNDQSACYSMMPYGYGWYPWPSYYMPVQPRYLRR